MKKALALILCVILMFSISACAGEADIRGEQTEVVSGEEKEFELGQADGLNYENTFVGIGFNLESGWSFYTDEQIRELNNQTMEIGSEEYKEVMENADVVFDVQAVSADGTSNINVVLEKVSALALATFDFKTNYEKTFSVVKESFENMGFTDYTYEFVDLEIDGKTVTGVKNIASASAVSMYQKQFAVKCNGYIASITVTSMNKDTTDDILKTIYWTD